MSDEVANWSHALVNQRSALRVDHLAEKLTADVQLGSCMAENTGGPLQLFLACRRRPTDAQAWEALLREFYPSFRGIAGRLGRQYGLRSPEDFSDLAQEPVLKLSRRLQSIPDAALESDATISAYLRALAANTIRDLLRSRFAQKRGEMETVHLDGRLPELAADLSLRSAERATLLRQIDEMLEVPARDRSVFWLYFRQGFTAREISLIPSLQLSTEGVESLIHRLVALLRDRIGKTAPDMRGAKSGD